MKRTKTGSGPPDRSYALRFIPMQLNTEKFEFCSNGPNVLYISLKSSIYRFSQRLVIV